MKKWKLKSRPALQVRTRSLVSSKLDNSSLVRGPETSLYDIGIPRALRCRTPLCYRGGHDLFELAPCCKKLEKVACTSLRRRIGQEFKEQNSMRICLSLELAFREDV